MCFSQPASAGFGLAALATGLWLKGRGHPARRYQMFLFFAIMEAIQFFSYFVVDQCDNPWNKFLTALAFLHVMYQGVIVNIYFLSPEYGVHPEVRRVVCIMCATCGTMGWLTKLPWPVWLGASPHILDGLAKKLPDLFSYTMAGTPEACRFETMCAPQVCTFNTPNHIAWSVPAMPPSYYLPCGFVHFFFFFFPTLIAANWIARFTMLGAFLTGPLLTQLLAARHMDTYKFEWPATWCYLSVAQVFITVAGELLVMRHEAKQARKGANGANGTNGTDGKVVVTKAKAEKTN